MNRRMNTTKGFTLLELMIAMVLLSVVILGVFESLTRQHKASIVTEDIVEVQNNTRAISALLEREIRMAGFMVPNATAVCGVDSTTGPDELYISETEPIVPDDERSGDLGARITEAGFTGVAGDVVAGTGETLTLDSTTTDLDGDGTWFYDNDVNGTPEADFRLQGGFIIGDLANPHRGALCGIVTRVTAADIDVTYAAGSLVAFIALNDAPEELVIVPAARYWINTTVGTKLMRNGDLLANSVEDFQVAYFFDPNNNGVADATELAGMPALPAPGGIVYDPAARDNEDLKEIRFSFVVRSRTTDPEFTGGLFISNNNRAAVAGNDGFRRRTIEGRVRPRNIGVTGSI